MTNHCIFAKLSAALCLLCALSLPAKADGVMRPTNPSYPKDFLRNRMTSISVAIHGQVAVTTVYQEFVNEWTEKTSAVYSFPLPPDARATDFLFWSNDTLYRATLKPKEQATNPGTGEGGVDALLNKYLGSNPLRVLINDIPGGDVQRVEMEFVSLCKTERGKLVYKYPLATAGFTPYAVESVFLKFDVEQSDAVSGVELVGFPDGTVTRTDSSHISLQLDRSKVYLTDDITFNIYSDPARLSLDFFATNNDSLGGNFVMFVKPPSSPDSTRVLSKTVVFLIDCSSSVAGEPLLQTIQATKDCLDRLRPTDAFNVVTFNYSPYAWSPQTVAAMPDTIVAAKNFLSGTTAYGYSELQSSLLAALGMFKSDSTNNVLFVFTDGRAPVDPAVIHNNNGVKVAIFPIAIGDNVRRSIVETLAYQNYGVPTFVPEADPISASVASIFDCVDDPILRDVRLEMGSNAFDLHPGDLASVYGGSRFFLTGRFHNAGMGTVSIGGSSSAGPEFYNFVVGFPDVGNQNGFAAKLWAKEKIDDIERTIDIDGATDSLKNLDISISLRYGIRCMYTAYVADKSNRVSEVEEPASILTFDAIPGPDGVVISWTFGNPAKIREVNLYRSENSSGPYLRVNEGSLSGTSFRDHEGTQTCWYQLEIITTEGQRILSAVVPGAGKTTPDDFALMQNYPNPFNPTTGIRYQVTGHSNVRLVVYDILGREVAVLVNERNVPGSYEVRFNGAKLSSGVYFYELTAGAKRLVRSMILAK